MWYVKQSKQFSIDTKCQKLPAKGAPINVAIPRNMLRNPNELESFSKPRNSTRMIAQSETQAAVNKQIKQSEEKVIQKQK